MIPKLIPDIAIIICTFNPEDPIFSRVLKAVEKLESKDILLECVIVDNNSSTPITEMASVQTFLQQCSWAKIIRETKQGLTFARIAGVKSTTAPIIVFFDDDNEPDSSYLEGVLQCFDRYPCVAAWGPGKITVEYLESVPDWFAKQFSAYSFQARDSQYTEYGRLMAKWVDFYPFGTGLVVKREILEKYYQAVATGKLLTKGREGNSLSSSEDLQIVWEAVKLGFAAGTSPELRLTHLIPGRRSNWRYVKRLAYGCAMSYMPALIESFPSEKEKALASIPSNKTILRNIGQIIKRNIFKFKYKILLVQLAEYIGDLVGMLHVTGANKHYWIYSLVKILHLDGK